MGSPKKDSSKDGWMFKIDNNKAGQFVLKVMKEALNKQRYSIRARGRKPNHDKIHELYPDQSITSVTNYSVPLCVADQLAIYVDDRTGDKERSRLWDENYKLKEELKRLVDLEKQVNELETELQEFNIRQNFEPKPDHEWDTLTQQYVPKQQLTNYHVLVKDFEALQKKHATQVLSIQQISKRHEEAMHQRDDWKATATNQLNELACERDRVVQLQADNSRLTTELNQLGVKYSALKDSMVQHTITNNEHVLEDLRVLLQTALGDFQRRDQWKKNCKELDRRGKLIKQHQKILNENGKVITRQQERIDKLEAFIQRLESESAGLSCLLQNDMRDLDIPISD